MKKKYMKAELSFLRVVPLMKFSKFLSVNGMKHKPLKVFFGKKKTKRAKFRSDSSKVLILVLVYTPAEWL